MLLTNLNQNVYKQLHETLLHQPTRREKQLTKMIEDPIRTPVVYSPKFGMHKCYILGIHMTVVYQHISNNDSAFGGTNIVAFKDHQSRTCLLESSQPLIPR